MIAETGTTCTVEPFHGDYEGFRNIPIVTACTAYDDPITGETILLIFHQVLWFGASLETSLICTQQVRSYGKSLCDDPYDKNRSIGIEDPETDIKIPFDVNRSMVGVTTRCPSKEEVTSGKYRTVTLTSNAPWDPSNDNLPHHRGISSIRQLPHGQPKGEYDALMQSCSTAMSADTFARSVIRSIKVHGISSVNSAAWHAKITVEELAQKFRISLDTALATLKATTQRGLRSAVHPLTRRYRTGLLHGMEERRLPGKWYTDTFFSRYKSIRGNTCAQLFTNTTFISVHPMATKADAGHSLNEFTDDVGIPTSLVFDGAAEQTGPKTLFMKTIQKLEIYWRQTEPYCHWQNRAEDGIRKLCRRWKRTRLLTGCSNWLWDFGMVHEARILQRIARGRDNRTGFEHALGYTPDISEDIDFSFYDPVWYITQPGDQESPYIGRWLGISHRVGNAMCFWVLTGNGNAISTSTVQHVTSKDLTHSNTQQRLEAFDTSVSDFLKDPDHVVPPDQTNHFFHQDVDIDDPELEPVDPNHQAQEADEYTPDAFDQYLGLQLMLTKDGESLPARVTKRLRTGDGTPIGTAHANPMLDTQRYEVEFGDGTTAEYYANVIAENLYSQVDSEGRSYVILKGITDHRKDQTVVSKEDGTYTTKSGRTYPKQTTRGWKLCVEWNDDTTNWIPLKDLKESNPIETAEYAVANKIADEPAFSWWVPYVLKRRNRIISKVKNKYWKTTHKFGIELPHSVQEALEIDRKLVLSGAEPHWRPAIEKEMKKIRSLLAFERVDGITPDELRSDATKLPGYSEVGLHMIFDIKMDGKFTKKARLVANGNETPALPKYDQYASVVSRESVRIGFLYAALNDLDILSCDISNAYLNASCGEKLWTEAGPEFGTDVGSVMILRKAIYGLKTAGNSWHKALAELIDSMGFTSNLADPDVWTRKATRENGEEYYEWIICYVDDILAISENPKGIMEAIGSKYDLKDTVKPPERYLGANIGRWKLPDGRETWCMSGKDYIKSAIVQARKMLERKSRALPTGKQVNRPMRKDYRPELDVSLELGPEETAEYQQLIGMLRWGVELGRIDYSYELSLLSSHLAMPREGHMEAVYGIFGYLAQEKSNTTLVFDALVPKVSMDSFPDAEWTKSIYGEGEEELPRKRLEPLGLPMRMVCFVDASHSGDLATRRSHTGFIIYLNNTPIYWYSKKQNTVETSTFGSELVAMRTAMEAVKTLRIKLVHFGIPLDEPTYMLGDNESVVKSTSRVEAQLGKKHQSICWHAIREAASQGWLKIGWEPSMSNIADFLTKALAVDKRRELLRYIFPKYGWED